MSIERFIPAKNETQVLEGLYKYTNTVQKLNQDILFDEPKNAELASRLGRVYRIAPNLQPGVTLALAKANADDAFIARVAQASLYREAVMAQEAEELRNKNKSWLQRNIYDKFKNATRWAVAAGSLPFDLANSMSAKLLLTPVGDKFKFGLNNPFSEGWFAQTGFGTMLMDDEKSGSGFFLGGDAEAARQQRVMDYAGSLPLTVEAGASVDTAFQPDPEDIRQLAIQISAEKGITFDEALQEAEKEIRANARIPFTFTSVYPMAVGETAGRFFKPLEFKYEDMGSVGYNTVSMLGALGLGLALPDPVELGFRNIAKPLWRYTRGTSKVDDAGNFIVDYTHAATTTEEAQFLAKVDALNVAVNKFETMGLDAKDAAVETLTPQPGVWYHGSKSGKIGKFTDIEDPTLPSGEQNLFGPGLYTSESPLITQTRGYQPRSLLVQDLSTQEIETLKNAGINIPSSMSRALNEEEMKILRKAYPGSVLEKFEPPATVYRFSQKTDVEPKMFDADIGLTVEQRQPLIEAFVTNSEIAKNFVPYIEESGFKNIITQEVMEQKILKRVSDNLSFQLGTDMTNNWDLLRYSPQKFSTTIQKYMQDIVNYIESDNLSIRQKLNGMEIPNTPQAIGQEIVFRLGDFVENYGRLPLTYDEMVGMFGGESGLSDFLGTSVSLSEYAAKRAKFMSGVKSGVGTPREGTSLFMKDLIDSNPSFDGFLEKFLATEEFFFAHSESFIDSLKPSGNIMTSLQMNFEQATRLLTNFTRVSPEYRTMLEDFDKFLRKIEELHTPAEFPQKLGNAFYEIRPLTFNQKLASMGFDGIEHTGGGRAGAGAFTHRVKIWFDPVKNLDITDPLTGASTPVNQALKNLVDANQYFDEAGKLRDEMDQLKASYEAGVIPGTTDVDPEQFKTYFAQSRQGKFAVDQIWKTVSTDNETRWYDLWKMFDGRLPLEVLDEISKAGSRDELLSILNSRAGWTPGLSNINDLNFSLSKVATRFKQASRIDKLMEGIEELGGKFWHRTPETTSIFINGSDAQKMQGLRDLEAWLMTGARIEPQQVKVLVQQLGLAMLADSKTAKFEAVRAISKSVRVKVLAATGDEKYAKTASDLFERGVEEAMGGGTYNVSAEGLRSDNGYAATIGTGVSEGGTYSVKLQQMVHGGPGLLSELVNVPLELPDVQQIRRAVSFIGYFTGKQGLQRALKKTELLKHAEEVFDVKLTPKELEKLGELRVPLRVIDFAMTKVWKNLKKFSGAYAVRNTMEAQARMAMTDRSNLLTHAIDYIQVAMHWKVPDDILLGEAFNPAGWSGLGRAFENTAEEYQTFLNAGHFGTEARMDLVKSQYRNGSFGVFPKDFNNGVSWANAGAYELRQLAADPIVKMLARGAKLEDVMTWLYSNTPESQKVLRQIEDLMRNGEVFYPKRQGFGPETGQIVSVNPTRANVQARIKAQQVDRLAIKTGGDENLKEVVHSGTINGQPAWKPNGDPTPELKNYLLENINNENLPRFYKGRGESAKFFSTQASWFEQASRYFFDKLVGWEYNALDRSPLWRMEYAKEVMRLAPLLSADESAKLLAQIEGRVAYYGNIARESKTVRRFVQREFTLQDYLGSGVDAEEFKAVLGTARGNLALEDLHVYANALTLNKLEKLLFDAAARNSITDAARVAAPFGAAFAEVWKKMVPLLAKNPDKVEKTFRTFQTVSGQNAPEGLKVNGVLHKDPITGEYMYSVPMTGTIARLMIKAINIAPGLDTRTTGSRYSLEAPVQGLNMAFNVVPGFSPVVGFPLGKLMFGSPKLRDIAQMLMPYGQPKSPLDPKEYLPGWASKLISAFQADPKRDALYADVLSDVIRVEMATGKWDISDSEQRQQFFADAEAKARVLTFMRGIGQFLGPAAPQITAKVRTEMGDVYTSFLTAEFHKFQSENYDTAVARFLNMYGEDTFMYMAGKTREIAGGIEASKEFAKWELENGELFDEYGEVAGFFGPKGSNFDWAAWQYQINTGKRERVLPIPDQINEAEQIIGLAKYRYFVKIAGPNPTDEQKAILAREKSRLEEEYPGMLTLTSFDVTRFDRRIKLLTKMANDPRLAQNETAIALRQYLSYRDQLNTILDEVGVGFKSDKARPLRDSLLYYGTTLVDVHPEFGRVFDRILVQEVTE